MGCDLLMQVTQKVGRLEGAAAPKPSTANHIKKLVVGAVVHARRKQDFSRS